MDRYVGLGEIQISSIPGDIIKTFALASCVGITAYCAPMHTAGMIHIVLPGKAGGGLTEKPCYYAVTGIPIFINKMKNCGCDTSKLEIKVYGGANSIKKGDCFNIGMRNLRAVSDIFKKLHVPFNFIDVGGEISRTLIMDVSTGAVTVNKLPICI